MAAIGSGAGNGDVDFLRESLDSLADRRLLLPAFLLVALLAGGKIALLANLPSPGDSDHLPYLVAFMLALLMTMALVVAILRILNRSVRPPWQPDLSLMVYGMTIVAGTSIDVAADFAVGGKDDLLGGLAALCIDAAVGAPLAVWFVAIAVESPLAWRPDPWFRNFRLWLPSLLFWGFVMMVPLRQLLLMLDQKYLTVGADWSWPAALVEAPLAAAAGMVSLALASTAYRRVAYS